MEFLRKGLQNAQLTLNVQMAFEKSVDTGDNSEFKLVHRRLLDFRRTIEEDSIANLQWLKWSEDMNWKNDPSGRVNH